MKAAGFSINIISLMALSLAVGLLIDDAIVVRENIFRRMELGEDPKTAAIKGTKEVQLAVIATTLAVISVFAPVAFASGMIGRFLTQFGLTICFAMAISLFDALTIAPMLSCYLASRKAHTPVKSSWRILSVFTYSQILLARYYERLLRFTFRHPLSVLLISFCVFLVSTVSLKKVPFTFMPEIDNGQIVVTFELPPGTNLDAMNRIGAQADAIIRANKDVEKTVLTVGGTNGEPYKADIFVQLVPSKMRSQKTSSVKNALRDQLNAVAQANPKIVNSDPGGNQHSRSH